MVTVAGRLLAYITQSIHNKRCDRPLSWLAALGGRKVSFRGLGSSSETVTQLNQVSLDDFFCVSSSECSLVCTLNFNFLAWFLFFKNIFMKVLKWYIFFFMKYSLLILSSYKYTCGRRSSSIVTGKIPFKSCLACSDWCRQKHGPVIC